jgi:hypothetical protein
MCACERRENNKKKREKRDKKRSQLRVGGMREKSNVRRHAHTHTHTHTHKNWVKKRENI